MKLQPFVPALLLTLALNALAYSAKGQDDDYVVNVKGDTIKCRVTLPLLGGKARYKMAGGETKKVNVKEIKSYYLFRRDKLYRAVFYNERDEADYLTVVENGIISLYEIIYTTGGVNGITSNTTNWHIGKNSDVVMPLKTNGIAMSGKSAKERREALAELFKDKPDVYARYKADEKFSFDQIQALVKWYNTGVTPEQQEEQRQQARQQAEKDNVY